MKSYTLAELQELKAKYLLTLDDDNEDDWYYTHRESAAGELTNFFRWLNIKENTP